VEKDLFAGRPDEIITAVYTLDWAILEFHLWLTPLTV
jgi:hypothetical protein